MSDHVLSVSTRPSSPQRVPSRRTIASSLSPAKTRKLMSATFPPRPSRKPRDDERQRCSLAMSRTETIVVSATGDVLVCRSRDSPYAIEEASTTRSDSERKDEDSFWWGRRDSSLCGMCLIVNEEHPGEGLLGGAVNVAGDRIQAEDESKLDDDAYYFVSETKSTPELHFEIPSDADEASLGPLPSFDYSHFADDGNDMEEIKTPQKQLHSGPLSPVGENESDCEANDKPARRLTPPLVMHGVPTFLPAFSQIRVESVSAHPLGSHVLLISSESLLFSFGLNDHGQLGLGRKTSTDGTKRGFITRPTIVTPLLENGGKATVCAAGVNHSLVVIKTEGRRVGRMRPISRTLSGAIEMTRASSSPTQIDRNMENGRLAMPFDDPSESMMHHQLYGFGANDCRKLGLINASEVEKGDVLVPHRVALHCSVWPEVASTSNPLPVSGIFQVAASSHHSAALVRQATGATQLYTWGDNSEGALAQSEHPLNHTAVSAVVPAPTVVPALSTGPSGKEDIPVGLALGPTSTIVVTSRGRCLTFGSSDDGLLGQGENVTFMEQPNEVSFPSPAGRGRTEIQSVSVGARHAVAIAVDGSAYSWGVSLDGRTGLGSGRLERSLSRKSRQRGSNGELLGSMIEWKPRAIKLSLPERPKRASKGNRRAVSDSQLEDAIASCRVDDAPPRAEEQAIERFASACAGYDGTVLVTKSGSVLSCGKSSGRLGQGERTADSESPASVFGGLCLWR